MPSESADPHPAREPDWARFPKKATYRRSAAIRRGLIGLVPLLLIVPALFWPFVFDGAPVGRGALVFVIMTLTLLAFGAMIVRYALNARFEFDARSITVTGLGRARTLPLSQVQALTAKRQPRGGSLLVSLHAADGRRPKFHVEPRHLRDDDLFAWLLAVPRRGGDPIVRPAAAKKPTPGTRIASLLVAILVLPALWIIFAGPADELRALAFGYPPLERLSSVQGTVLSVGHCRSGGRGTPPYVPIEIATESGPVGTSLPCDLERLLGAAPGPHQVAVWRDKRLFAGDQVREIRIDGRAVQRYEDYLARSRRALPFFLVAHLLVIATLVLTVPAVFDRNARD